MTSSGAMRVDFSESNNESQVYDFIDMTSGYFELTDNQMSSQMCLKSLPATILFNKLSLPPSIQEYAWITEIDTNSDGVGDFLLQSSAYTFDTKEFYKPITQGVQSSMWRISSRSNSVIANVPVTFSSSGNCLNWTVPRTGAHASSIQAITGFARIRMYTQAVTPNASSSIGVNNHQDIFKIN